jgi:hypothetical protein
MDSGELSNQCNLKTELFGVNTRLSVSFFPNIEPKRRTHRNTNNYLEKEKVRIKSI